jgi:hypothetical protein
MPETFRPTWRFGFAISLCEVQCQNCQNSKMVRISLKIQGLHPRVSSHLGK